MFEIFEELKALVAALHDQEVQYALCGGLAMAVHGVTRATVDIDVLIPPEDLNEAKRVARKRGFDVETLPAKFGGGAVEIHRVSKIEIEDPGGDVLTLDLLVVSPRTLSAWESRQEVAWEGGSLWVVSREGLISLKEIRGSGQDKEDIRKLRGDEA